MISVKTIAQTIAKHAGITLDTPTLSPRPNDVDRLAANTMKAKKLLLYKPAVPIEEGINVYMNWLQSTYPDLKKLLKQIPAKNW